MLPVGGAVVVVSTSADVPLGMMVVESTSVRPALAVVGSEGYKVVVSASTSALGVASGGSTGTLTSVDHGSSSSTGASSRVSSLIRASTCYC
jgi:hypothetical protein